MTRQEEIKRRYTRVEKGWDGWGAVLCVPPQFFRVAMPGTRAEARAFRDQLAKALNRLIAEAADER